MNKSNIIIILLLLSALLSIVLYKKNRYQTQVLPVISIDPAENCQLNQQACKKIFSNQQIDPTNSYFITLDIFPKPIPLVSPLQVEVQSNLPQIQQVRVEFKGVDMDMGPNTIMLEKQAAGKFAGKAMLSVCIRKKMAWQAIVSVNSNNRWVTTSFMFYTQRK